MYKTSRSYAESVLVSLIEKCWIYDPDKRIDIFEIVNILKNALQYINSNTNTLEEHG